MRKVLSSYHVPGQLRERSKDCPSHDMNSVDRENIGIAFEFLSLEFSGRIKLKLVIEENVPLAPYTTLGVGGPARFLAKTQTQDEVQEAVHFARQIGCPVF